MVLVHPVGAAAALALVEQNLMQAVVFIMGTL
jgi:hypothetical protein